MRINLEGVRRRREDLIDRIKFGDEYPSQFSKFDSHNGLQFSNNSNKKVIKWIVQSSIAVMLVVSTFFLQHISSPWAKTSVSFLAEVVERDYNWQGVLEALPVNGILNNQEGLLTPSMSSADSDLYNEYIAKYPNNNTVAPVFGQTLTHETSPNMPPNNTTNGTLNVLPNLNSLPIEGLLVKKFTTDKPFLEFIALSDKDVVAVTGGIVKNIGYNDKKELLLYIENNEITYVYGRLIDVIVKEGDKVESGQKLAQVAVTNDVELLLFQIIKGDKAIDPEPLLP